MAADAVKCLINPEQSCDKQGVRHEGGQLRETEGGTEEESYRSASVTLTGQRVIQMTACPQSSAQSGSIICDEGRRMDRWTEGQHENSSGTGKK